VERWTESEEEKNLPKHFLEPVKHKVGEVTRDNLPVLKNKAETPTYA